MDSRAWRFILSNSWLLHRPVLADAAAIVFRKMEGIDIDRSEIEKIAAGRDSRVRSRDRVLADDGACMDGFDNGLFEAVRETGPWGGPDELGPLCYRAKKTSVFVVPVQGVISKYSGLINGMSQPQGVTSDRLVRSVLTAGHLAVSSGSVLLDIDSPGGTTAGMQDIIDAITAIREDGVRVAAIARDSACSGGLLVALQADAIYATPQAMVGSIGCYRVLSDTSRAVEEWGEKRYLIASGPYKGAGEEGTAITGEMVEQQLREVQQVADWFIGIVADRRGMSLDAAKSLATGATWTGQQALQIGLVDGVMGVVDLVRAMRAESGVQAA